MRSKTVPGLVKTCEVLQTATLTPDDLQVSIDTNSLQVQISVEHVECGVRKMPLENLAFQGHAYSSCGTIM